MSRHPRAALAAAVVVAAFTHAPAAATERATLKVTARVVDRCTIEVPSRVPQRFWHDRRDQPWRFVRQDCRGGPPLRVHAEEVLGPRLRERLLAQARQHFLAQVRQDGGRVRETRHPDRDDLVLITITY
jgi:hypothetical protein